MNSKISSNHESLAREAALAYAESDTVGALIEILDEGDNTKSYVFASTLKGYLGWRWSVTLFEADPKNPTLSEVMLLPGEESLVAPAWVPWSERLADYKALQAELEAQAAADAAEAAEAEVADEEEDDDDDKWVEPVDEEDSEDESDDDEPEEADETVLAATDLEPGEDAESEAEDAGDRPPRSARRNRRWGRKKDR